ncbi:MAG: aspartate/glutamate racemase family protein [Victivallales bacterium]|nr:aspartate/glutamate racemase family protein [Victivallales bacterium]
MKRIIVCDSGLGGLNIAANLFQPGRGRGAPCEVIYFNALPSRTCGFNQLPSARAQEEVLRDVLESMKSFSPDGCLMACNTLSIIYERLLRWYTPAFPVQTITACATQVMVSALGMHPDLSLLIMGTKTTVESGFYQAMLAKEGADVSRVRGVPCPGLATMLERGPESRAVKTYVKELSLRGRRLFDSPPPRIALMFCCTHYDYGTDLIKGIFSQAFSDSELSCESPNSLMGKGLLGTSFTYHSRLALPAKARQVFGEWFRRKACAPAIAEALQNVQAEPRLFPFSKPQTDSEKSLGK